MNFGQTIFSQLMDFITMHEFNQCVKRYNGNYKIKTSPVGSNFSAWLLHNLPIEKVCGIFKHACVQPIGSYTTWAFEARFLATPWLMRIRYVIGVFMLTLHKFLLKKPESFTSMKTLEFNWNRLYMPWILRLSTSLFPWALFRKKKGAVKLHTLIDLRGNIPTVIFITHGKVHDVNILDDLVIEAGAIYVMDRGYLDFERLYMIHQSSAFFVTRAKSNFDFKRLYSKRVDKATGVLCDQIVTLQGFYAKKSYPDKLRRIKYYDADKKKRLVFLTNNFLLPALTIAEIYRCRWQVELFFKWIKQHLRIKAFYGTSENAVKTQIWIAISVYVLVAIIKKRLNLNLSLYTILQILSVSLFEKTRVLQALTSTYYNDHEDDFHKQLILFD